MNPLVVTEGPGMWPVEIRLRRGSELRIEAVEAGTGAGIPGVFFWLAPSDRPSAWRHLDASTSWSGPSATDRQGRFHAVLDLPQGGSFLVKVGEVLG